MEEILKEIYKALDTVIPGQVSYGTRQIIDSAIVKNYIVYQELSNKGSIYADDEVVMKVITIQVNLITEKKDLVLEERFEASLYLAGYDYQLVSEFQNDDLSINRVYEIKMEVF
ncbi:MAG: hypothetical protein WC154_00245 [Candidatus Izemoplasmatales bacterium]